MSTESVPSQGYHLFDRIGIETAALRRGQLLLISSRKSLDYSHVLTAHLHRRGRQTLGSRDDMKPVGITRALRRHRVVAGNP